MVVRRITKWWREAREWRREHVAAWADHRDPLDSGLSKFQYKCESRLVEALAQNGFRLVDRKFRDLDGSNPGREPCIEARIERTDWTVWIYVDGAQVSSESETIARLEEWDAKTPDELISELIRKTTAAIEKL